MGVGTEREKAFDSMAWWLHRHGVRPNHVSFLQIPVYIAMVYVAYLGEEVRLRAAFGVLQILAFLIDGADGILARRTGTVTRRGHLVDEVFDITGIGITIWAVNLYHSEHSNLLLALLLVNFLVYIQNEIQGTKNITYTRGPLTVGFYLELFYPGIVLIGIVLPLAVGVILLFTRVAWRQRAWTYYQFLTAGLRQEYKATPRKQRVELLGNDPRMTAGRPSGPRRDAEPSADDSEEPPAP